MMFETTIQLVSNRSRRARPACSCEWVGAFRFVNRNPARAGKLKIPHSPARILALQRHWEPVCMAEAEESGTLDSQAQAALAAARRIAEARPAGGWACHIRLSHLPRARLKDNFSFAVNILRSAVERFLGRIFVLPNSDILVVCWQTRRWQLRSAILSLQPLFE